MSQLPFDEVEQNLIQRAEALEAKAKALRDEAYASRGARDLERPLVDRLVFAAYSRCVCGAGMAYDPTGAVHSPSQSPFREPHQWECSTILRHYGGDLSEEEFAEAKKIEHSSPMPFAYYEVKSEDQPSANGATTRQPAPPAPEARASDPA